MFKTLFRCPGQSQRLVGPVIKPDNPVGSGFIFEKLEPRLLLSADAIGAAVGADLLDDRADTPSPDNPQPLHDWLARLAADIAQTSPLSLKSAEPAALDLSQFPADQLEDGPESWQEQWAAMAAATDDVVAVEPRLEWVFVDTSVDNYQQLVADLQTNEQVNYQLALIDRDSDGIAQLSHALQGQTGIDAIHLVTHGSDGVIQLGSSVLDSESLAQQGEALSVWQQALSADADVLIYGCDVAATPAGEQFLEQLSGLLGADIAASDDLTGARALGGNWTLEYRHGVLDTQLAFSYQLQQQWQGSLATAVVTTTSWTVSLLSDTSSIDALNASSGGLDGRISLLEAIQAANNGANTGSPDVILFDLPGSTVITPLSEIPALTDAVIIDGLAGSGQSSPFVEINGAFTFNDDGFVLLASDSTIHGMIIHSFDYDGIWVLGDNNLITGNFIGTGPAGNEDLGNGLNGIRVDGVANTIGGALAGQANLIGNNGQNGVLVYETSDTVILGNKIGVTLAGDTAMANGSYGIQIFDSADNTIGGANANEGNLISGNSLAGIIISANGSSGNSIVGNFIGTNAVGDAAVANGGEGILIADRATDTTIGGTADGAENLISGNGLDGIHLNGQFTSGNQITGNLIGTTASGFGSLGNGQDGIRIIDSPDNQIGGVTAADRNTISANSGNGIAVFNNKATGNVIAGNYIGTDSSGFAALGNLLNGIRIDTGASNNTVGGNSVGSANVISGNLGKGVQISSNTSTGNSIVGNFIGTNASGFGALGNGSHGVFIENARNNLIGGSTAAERNIISGNGGDGIAISGTQATGNVVRGNYIGTDVNGTGMLSNAGSGVRITADLESGTGGASSNTIGGSLAGEGNIIAGNLADGVVLSGSNVEDNIVQGNYIGTDVNGSSALANGVSGSGVGVRIDDGAANNRIGGQASALAGNLISGNTDEGILIDGIGTDGNTVEGNKIGTDINGVLSLANGASGILIQNGASNNIIGGTSALAANTIAFNAQAGVRITEATSIGNTLRSNAIHSNSGLGIDLSTAGVTGNDALDGDSGANGNQNFPVLTTAQVNGVNISIVGSINTTASTSVAIDFFYSDSADASGNGEGRVFIGTTTVVTDAAGNQTFDVNFAMAVSTGQFVTATATTADGTSEFAANIVTVSSINAAPSGSVTISGVVQEDQVLTASNDLTDANGIPGMINYQWQRDGVAIAGATASTYTLGDADVGAAITVLASYVDGLGKAESVTSSPTVAVLNVNDPLTGNVTISGTAADNAVLTATETLADDDGISGLINFQWRADGVDITGATDASYQLTDAEVGKVITVVASYTDDNNTAESIESAATAQVVDTNDAVTGSVTIPATAADNEVLTASNDLADEDGIASISYQWFNDGGAIAGATAVNYSVTDSDVGQQLYVQATVTDNLDNVEVKISNTTAVVTDTNDAVTGSVTIPATAADNELLTASNTFADEDGIASISYQWFNDGGAIAGATAVNYSVTDSDVGQQLYVQATVTDSLDNIEVKISNTTAVVTDTNDAVTGSVTIPATAADNEVLTASNTFADEDGIASISYQWFNDGGAIAGATAVNYTVTDSDVGQQLYVQATVTDSLDNVEVKISNTTAVVTDTNDAVTGSVTIPATAADNELLTASNTFADEDGIASISYQWFNDGGAIAGATAVNYTVTDSDVGQQLYVQATVTDSLDNVEVKISNTTAVVTDSNDAVSGGVAIAGSAVDNSVLTATNTLSDDDGIASISYQWFNGSGAIAGATGVSYTVTDADVGQQLFVQATVLDNLGNSEVKTSALTALVTDVNDPVVGSVTIQGLNQEDQLLTASNNLSDQDGLGSISYQWQRNGVNISGATADSYRLTDSDVGATISVTASYRDQANNIEQVTSAATAVISNVNDSPQGSVVISGVAAVDELLSASQNLTDADGLGTLSYQWQRDGVDIDGATASTYRVTTADNISVLTVKVSYVDNNNTAESVSSAGIVVSSTLIEEIIENSKDDTSSKPETPATDNASAETSPEDTGSDNSTGETAEETAEDSAGDNSNATQAQTIELDLGFQGSDNAGDRLGNRGINGSDISGIAVDSLRGIESASGFDSANSGASGLEQEADDLFNLDLKTEAINFSGLASSFSSLNDPMNLVGSSNLKNSLDDVQQQMQNNLQLTQAVIGGSVAVSSGISVGYVVWLIRSGAILSSVMSALPAWRFIDPLPILSAADGGGEEDQESLQSMVDTDSDEPGEASPEDKEQ